MITRFNDIDSSHLVHSDPGWITEGIGNVSRSATQADPVGAVHIIQPNDPFRWCAGHIDAKVTVYRDSQRSNELPDARTRVSKSDMIGSGNVVDTMDNVKRVYPVDPSPTVGGDIDQVGSA